MSGSALSIRQLYKSYGQQRALNGASLEVAPGMCMVLLGPSGCGKSTLLKSINRLVPLDSGDILLNGRSVVEIEPTALRRQMGYGIQGVGLFPHYTVADNIAVVPRLLKWPEPRISERISELLALAGLPEAYRSKYPSELSGGEAQRVGVLRALAADPPILLMDEPFGAVDPLTREKLQQAFMAIQRQLKKTVIFVTHDVSEAVMLADRIAVMAEGRIVACEAPKGHLGPQSPDFVRSFLGHEYPLSLLGRYTLGDFLAWKGRKDFRGAEGHAALQRPLMGLLAELMGSAGNTLTVPSAEGGTLEICLEDLRAFTAEVVL